MRGFLHSGFEPTTVTTQQFEAPLVDPLSRGGWNSDMSPRIAKTTISLLDFGSGKSGIYNFVDNQWHNQLRHRRIVVRGSKGELRTPALFAVTPINETAAIRAATDNPRFFT